MANRSLITLQSTRSKYKIQERYYISSQSPTWESKDEEEEKKYQIYYLEATNLVSNFECYTSPTEMYLFDLMCQVLLLEDFLLLSFSLTHVVDGVWIIKRVSIFISSLVRSHFSQKLRRRQRASFCEVSSIFFSFYELFLMRQYRISGTWDAKAQRDYLWTLTRMLKSAINFVNIQISSFS